MNSVVKKHRFCYGHRIFEHKGKCRYPHGHNAEVFFEFSSDYLNPMGMVIDFETIKKILCKWVDDNFDHRFFLYENDPLVKKMGDIEGVVKMGFNPTSENLASYLLHEIGPNLLNGKGYQLTSVKLRETESSYAVATR